MFDEYRMEDLVIQGIYVLRDTKRKDQQTRIYTFMFKNYGNWQLRI